MKGLIRFWLMFLIILEISKLILLIYDRCGFDAAKPSCSPSFYSSAAIAEAAMAPLIY